MSLFVISTVVWLLLLFLSITEGIEKTWLSKLTSLNAPIRITPTENYYNSYYYQIDSLASASNYSLKSIGEKLKAEKTDPYDAELDEELPHYWPSKEPARISHKHSGKSVKMLPQICENCSEDIISIDKASSSFHKDGVTDCAEFSSFCEKCGLDEIDPVKGAFASFKALEPKFSHLVAEDYEVAGALMRLELIRPNSRNFQSFLSQVSYVATAPKNPTHLQPLIQTPSLADIKHLLYLATLYKENDLQERITANITSLEEGLFKNQFDEIPKLAPPWAYFVKGKLVIPENGIILPKQFRENDVLLGDKGYFSYQTATPMSMQEQKLPVQVVGFYDPGVISIGARFILADSPLVTTMNANSQTTALDPLLSNGIQLWFDDFKKTRVVETELQKEFSKAGIEDYWKIIPYYEYDFAKELISQFQSDRYLFMLVGILILTVACSNVISLLLLLVNDKKHEIGILLSLGASKKSIAFIFGGIGVSIGFFSSLIGIALAYFTLSHISVFVNFLSSLEGQQAFNPLFYGDSLPNSISIKALLFVLIASPILSLLAGLIPAIKACKLKPSAILRSE